MKKPSRKGARSRVPDVDVRRRQLLQAAVAAGGLQALGLSRAQAIERGLDPDTIFSDGFEPASSSGAMSFTVTAPTAQALAPVALGYAFRRGQVPAGSSVVANSGALQVTPRNVWPDGSLKFAQLVWRGAVGPTPSTIAMSVGTASAGTALTVADLQATGIVASIGCGAFGTVTFSGADWATPFQTAPGQSAWVSGALMSSWIYRKPVGSDAHLVAWLEVRLYQGGAVEVLPWIENGYLTVAAPSNKNATYTFALGGTQRFSAAIDLLNHQRTPLLSGSALSHWLGADPQVQPRHDTAYLQATDLVPTYFAQVPANAPSVNALVSTFQPLQRGNWPSVMGNAGSDPSIGLLPDWDVHYLTGPSTIPWGALQRNAYSAGRYGIHFRDQATQRPVNPASHPTLCLDDNGSHGITATGASSANNYTPTATGPAPPFYQNTHTPSMGYMAYLITGRFYHLETLQFHAMVNWLKQSDVNRGAHGILKSNAGACTVRGAAWSFRALFQAAAITPANDPLFAPLIASVQANIDYLHARYIAQPQNPFGLVSPYGDYTQNADNIFFEATWQQDFYTGVFGYATLLNLPIAQASQTQLAAFFQWKAKSVVGRLGGASANEFLYRDATPYILAFSPTDTPNFDNGSGPWYAHWGSVYDATYSAAGNGSPGPRVVGDLRGGNLPDAESYWGNFMPAIAYAVRLNVPGAEAGLARVTAEAAWIPLRADFDQHPVWSVSAQAPRAAGTPAWLVGVAINQWKEIPGSAMSAVPAGMTVPGTNPSARMNAWSGYAAKGTDIFSVRQGGHTDYYGNEVLKFDLGADTPHWTMIRNASTYSAGLIIDNTSRYSDGAPASVHGYAHQRYVPQRNWILSVGSTAVPLNGGSPAECVAYDIAANTFLPPGSVPDCQAMAIADHAVWDDPLTGDVYHCYARQVNRWNQGSNTWSFGVDELPNQYGIPGVACTDTTRRRAIIFSGEALARVPTLFDLATQTHTEVTCSGDTTLTTMGHFGLTYSPVTDRFYAMTGGANGAGLYEIDPTTWAIAARSTTGAAGMAADSGTGVYTRFLYIASLGGIVYFPEYHANAWFLRLH